jgi:disulfide bond formation protein DsbB
VGGALGNIIDRLRQGAVTDFLDFYWRDWHWPTFNVADIASRLGAVLILAASVPLAAARSLFLTKADPQACRATTFPCAAFLIALAATLGALFIGEVLGQMPCTLCWYQRIAMFPLVPILGLSLWRGDGMARTYALPLVVAGLALAAGIRGLRIGLMPANRALHRERPVLHRRGTDHPWPAHPLSVAGAFAAILACLILPKGTPCMNRRTLLIGASALGLAAFGGGAFFLNRAASGRGRSGRRRHAGRGPGSPGPPPFP